MENKEENNHKICFFNRGSIHYRKDIYILMDQDLKVDFYFGDCRPGKIKQLDPNILKNYKGLLHNIDIKSFYWQQGVIKLLKSDYTDFITTGDPGCLSTWLFIILAKFFNKKVFFWTHGAYGRESGLKKKITKWRMNKVDGLLLYGNYAKTMLHDWGISNDKMYVIYNSLAYDKQLILRQQSINTSIYRTHFKNDNPTLFFIGRLIFDKQLDMAIEAVSNLKKMNFQVNLVLIGDGPAKQSLVNLAEELEIIDNIWFYGPCYDESSNAELIYNADLCVTPGAIGLTAIHSLMFGTPVITHNDFTHQGPEFEAIEDGKTGVFFQHNDVSSLTHSIKQWFLLHPNRDIVRQDCYKVVDEKYNPHVQIKIIESAINN